MNTTERRPRKGTAAQETGAGRHFKNSADEAKSGQLTLAHGFQPMPGLTDDQYAALKADIESRGIVVRVVVDQHGRLLDGHHRRRIATELGIDCPVEVVHVADHDEAADLAVALNCARRHLTREQIRDVIRAELARRPQDSDRAVARRVGCSPSTVGAVRLSNLDSQFTPDELSRGRGLVRQLGQVQSELVDLADEVGPADLERFAEASGVTADALECYRGGGTDDV